MAIEDDKPARPEHETGRGGPSLRMLLIAALLVMLAGAVAGGWAVNRLLGDKRAPSATRTVDQPSAGGVAAAPSQPPLVVAPVDGAGALTTRVAELEQRLSRITLEAASASGNASRAERLLVALAARRALDRGMPLDYLDAQLRLRFGDDKPNAVNTIIETARNPITLEQLRARLEGLAPQLIGRSADGGGFWTALRREMSELFVIRRADTPSTRAAERLDRARRYLAGGQVDQAVKEVQTLPGAAAANDWLIDARRYNEARRALDVIETAAILEPRDGAAAMAETQADATP